MSMQEEANNLIQMPHVRREDDEEAARGEDPTRLRHDRPRVEEVFDHAEARDPVEARVPEWEMRSFQIREGDRQPTASRRGESGLREVHADRHPRRRRTRQHLADPAAHVEEPRPLRHERERMDLPARLALGRTPRLPRPDVFVKRGDGGPRPHTSHVGAMLGMGLSLVPGLRDAVMEGPRVSVVITVRDDPRVHVCIDAVLTQSTDFDFDVVVVDNRSTATFAQTLRSRFGRAGRVGLVTSGGNLSEAWNAGARSTSAPVLVRIDADAIPQDGWLAALARPLLDGRADWSAGPVGGLHPDRTFVGRYMHHRTEAYNRRLEHDPILRDAVPSWNVGYTRAALERAGWYDPWQASSVDWDLHKRLQRNGARGTFVREARALHAHAETWRDFVRKEAWYHTGQYQMVLKYGLRSMRDALLLPAAYGLLLVLSLLAILWWPVAWLALALLVILLAMHLISGYRDADPLWPYRILFRPVEGFAGLYGLMRGVVRFGVRAPARP